MVVILAAGKGSRFKGTTSKLITKIDKEHTTITRLISQFSSLGEKEFNIIVGHDSENLIKSVERFLNNHEDINLNVIVNYVYNNKYNIAGCEYSFSCCYPCLQSNEPLYVVEGDIVTSTRNIKRVTQMEHTSLLVRPPFYLDKRSVCVLTYKNQYVSELIYDRSHKADLNQLLELSNNLADSMQIWKFVGEDIEILKNKLYDYKVSVDRNYCHDRLSNGLFSINNLITFSENLDTMKVVECSYPDELINLDTVDDLNKIKECEWLDE